MSEISFFNTVLAYFTNAVHLVTFGPSDSISLAQQAELFI